MGSITFAMVCSGWYTWSWVRFDDDLQLLDDAGAVYGTDVTVSRVTYHVLRIGVLM